MLTINESKTISADIAQVWRIVSDVPNWHTWDPHIEQSRFEGDFARGGKGWTKPKGAPAGPFEVIAVDPERGYSTRSPMPFGKMLIFNTYEPAGDGKVTVARKVELYGAFVPLFRLIWAKGMRADILHTFDALESEALKRAGEAA